MENTSEKPDEDFVNYARSFQPSMLVVGCGGAGCNTVTRITDAETKGVETLAVNTDAQDLLSSKADHKLLIGRETTGGLGTGTDYDKGRRAAQERPKALKRALTGYDIVFVTYGLGGGTGTGAGPIISEISKKMGTLTVAIVTLPFEAEGKKRNQNAAEGLKKLRNIVDTTIIVPDDKLLEVAPSLSLMQAFELADSVLMNVISGISELVAEPGLINLDFEDVRATFKDNDLGVVGFGKYSGKNRAEAAVQEAIDNPLLDRDIKASERALISVVGSPDMELYEAEIVAGKVSEEIGPDARVAWGARVSEDLEDKIKVMIILSGAGESKKIDLDELGLESL